MKKIVILFSIVLLLVSCGSSTTEVQQKNNDAENTWLTLSDEQFKNAGITIGKLKQQPIASILKVNGVVEVPPQNIVSISVPLGGYLKFTKLLTGMHVSKGEVIAIVEDQQYIQIQQDYLTTKAQFTFTENEFNRQKELNQSKATSDKVFEQIRATYQSQLILIKSLEEKLNLIGVNPKKISVDKISRSINIYSPIDGYVSDVKVNIGKYVNPSDVLFELINPMDIHLALNIFEKDFDKLFIGQKLQAYTNNNPENKYDCSIILISKNLSSDRSVLVHCHFEKYNKTLLPGMFMNAELEVKSKNATVLPESAVVRFENKQYVFVVKDKNIFELVEVKIGNTFKGFIEVEMDSNFINKNFVFTGAYSLLMKMKNVADD